jgi:hypothetical protein
VTSRALVLALLMAGCSEAGPVIGPDPTPAKPPPDASTAESAVCIAQDPCGGDEQACGFYDDGCGHIVGCPRVCPKGTACAYNRHCVCVPKPFDEACSSVQCGITADGCGGWIFCTTTDVESCTACQEDFKYSGGCPEGLIPYQCSAGVIPFGCFQQGTEWCCALF